MKLLHLDTETYSECDLRKAGAQAYARHPSTEVIVAQWAVGDEEPHVRDCSGRFIPPELRALLEDPEYIIVAHNSAFDRIILKFVWGIDIPPERWLDTMICAYAHSLPGALEKVGLALGVDPGHLKDPRGKELIQLFCKPRPKNMKLRRATAATHPTEWAEFLEYSRQDIVAMRAIHHKLPVWNFAIGHREHALWCLDQRLNDRGFRIDTALARGAIAATTHEKARLNEEMFEETDGLVPNTNKRDALIALALVEYGFELPDLKGATLRKLVGSGQLPSDLQRLLELRLEATKASTAKYKAAIAAVCNDGRMRGTTQFGGAQRTMRWAGRIFQPQNMPRPSREYSAEEYENLCLAIVNGSILFMGACMQDCSDAIRGCIIAAEGKKLVVADLSNIEGRGLVYLSGETWKLEAFAEIDRLGKATFDMYVRAYARSFNVDPATVTKAMRQIGKVQELGLGYEGGVGAFLTFAATYNMDLNALADAVHSTAPKATLAQAYRMYDWTVEKRRTTHGLDKHVWIACEALKIAWREAHPATVQFWKDLADAARAATNDPYVVDADGNHVSGQAYRAGKHIVFRRDGAWLRMRLPSGRYLCYLNPQVDEGGTLSYMGINQYTRQWQRVKTYGGKLAENATQAFSRDIMAYNMPAIEDAGYDPVLTVHDEVVTETPDSNEFTHEGLASMLATVPEWAPGIPLAAAGFEATRYRKD